MVDPYAIVRRLTGHELISPKDARLLTEAVDGLIDEIGSKDARIAELEAEVERLTKEAAGYRDIAARKSSQVADMIRAEALSRTGAVKEREDHIATLKAENEQLHAQLVKATDPAYLEEKLRQIGVTDEMATEALSAAARVRAEADAETLIDTVSEEVWNHDASQDNCNVIDKDDLTNTDEPAALEGQQEPVPRNVIWFEFDENTGEFTGEYCSVKPADARGMRPYIPYTARPSEQAVTDEMVEAAQEAYLRVGKKHHWHPSWPDDDAMREILSAALAQEGK